MSSVIDAATVSATLWFSYLFTLLYIALATSGIHHRDLLLENPVKLPFLNVDLPLLSFFTLGPAMFVIVHAYVMLHFVMLAQKVGFFDMALRNIPDEETRISWRRRLPSNIFAQFLAGPKDVRNGMVGMMLRLITGISLLIAPIALLCLMELQFLPYHSIYITMWQRCMLLCDLALLWLLWPSIRRGEMISPGRISIIRQPGLLLATICSVSLTWFIATFPGDPLDRTSSFIGFPWPTEEGRWRDQEGRLHWVTLHRWLVGGSVDYVERRPTSIWSNRLVLPGFEIEQSTKPDADTLSDDRPTRLSLRGRHLEGAILIESKLNNVDFGGADLSGAVLNGADLRESKFSSVPMGRPAQVDPTHRCYENDDGTTSYRCTDLQNASLVGASLQGAELHFTILRGANLDRAHLQGADLKGAELTAASLDGADLRAASLSEADLRLAKFTNARLQTASLEAAHAEAATFDQADLTAAWVDSAWLQGASFDGAVLRYASMKWVSSWRADILYTRGVEGLRMEPPIHPDPLSKADFDAMNEKMNRALGDDELYDNDVGKFDTELDPDQPIDNADAIEEKWSKVFDLSPDQKSYNHELAQYWRSTACEIDGGPYILRSLLKRMETHNSLESRIPRPEGSDIAPLLLASDCAAAYSLSDREKARLRALGMASSPGSQK